MIHVVGIGPGSIDEITPKARKAIEQSECVVGYKTYIGLVKPLLTHQEIVTNGMRGEVERCKTAISLSRQGKIVSVISSGDAGVYGMAGLILELSQGQDHVEVISGVTASSAGAAMLGAPLMHDYCHISLSDLLTPLEVIMNRVKSAAQADFVICFYNPKSHGRPQYIKDAIEIIRSIKGDDIWVGIAKDVGREAAKHSVFKIAEVNYESIDMTTVVIVGNHMTRFENGVMITPRGYHL